MVHGSANGPNELEDQILYNMVILERSIWSNVLNISIIYYDFIILFSYEKIILYSKSVNKVYITEADTAFLNSFGEGLKGKVS